MKVTLRTAKGKLILLLIGLMMISGATYAQNTDFAIPRETILRMIQDIEQGRLCGEQLELSETMLRNCEEREMQYEAILRLLRESLDDCGILYQQEAESAKQANREAKKARFERNAVSGVLVVVLVLLLL